MSLINTIVFSKDVELCEDIKRSLYLKTSTIVQDLKIQFATDTSNAPTSSDADTVVFDLDLVEGNIDDAIAHINLLEAREGKRPLILLGNHADTNRATTSPELNESIVNIVNKPTPASQILKAIAGTGSQEPAFGSRLDKLWQNTTARYAVTASLLAIPLVLIFSGQDSVPSTKKLENELTDSEQQTSVAIDETPVGQGYTKLAPTPARTELGEASEISKLEVLAQQALSGGDTVSPADTSALSYFNRILDLDPYHPFAYQGKRQILTAIRANFQATLKDEDFNQAQRVLTILKEEEPFNTENFALETMLTSVVPGTRTSRRNASAPVATEKGDAFAMSQVKQAVQQAKLISDIEAAMLKGNLVPPVKHNALQLLSSAINSNSLNLEAANSLKSDLVRRLHADIDKDIAAGEMSKATSNLRFLRTLDPNYAELDKLASTISRWKKSQIASETQAEKLVDKATVEFADKTSTQTSVAKAPKNSDVLPFSLIKRVEPKYPRRAITMEIEGWVELEYQVNANGLAVNIEVVGAKPKNIFEKAGIKALKNWRFEPAKNQASGEAVLSAASKTKFKFSLNNS